MIYPFKTLHHRNAIAHTATPYFANIALYQLATGTVPAPNGTNDRPVSCAGNVNYYNCRAVIGHTSCQFYNLTIPQHIEKSFSPIIQNAFKVTDL
jgi:hypothetical protein